MFSNHEMSAEESQIIVGFHIVNYKSRAIPAGLERKKEARLLREEGCERGTRGWKHGW